MHAQCHCRCSCRAATTLSEILIVGHSLVATEDVKLVRFNTDGSLDTTFDGDGALTTPVGTGIDQGFAIALQILVARYLTNGSFDTSFSGDGLLTQSLSTGNDRGLVVALATDGKLVVAGSANGTGLGTIRLLTDGTLDATWGTGGIAIATHSSGTVNFGGLSIQPNGKILVSGSANGDYFSVRYWR